VALALQGAGQRLGDADVVLDKQHSGHATQPRAMWQPVLVTADLTSDLALALTPSPDLG
jgi:hypothetical protein